MKLFIKITFFICIVLMSRITFAEVKASVAQAKVYQGDPVTLIIENNQNNQAQPDLSPLQTDFEILGTSTSSQVNFVNGNRSFKKSWSIDLQPKSLGEIKIPAISVGGDETEPVVVTVNKLPPEVAEETRKHVFIESTVDIKEGETYVQQQIPYTVKLFYDSAMQTGEVISPKIENANIRHLGNDRKYQVIRAGKKFVVIEKRFVISPEKSGPLLIPPTLVKGRIALNKGDSQQLNPQVDETDMLNRLFKDFRQDPFFNSPFDDLFGRRSIGPTRPFSVSSQSIEVNVLPVPDAFKGKAWLPAEEVIATDSWAKQPPVFKVGEPVIRQLVLQVKGLASSQIPEIEIPRPAGVKVYPEQPRSETPNDGNTVYGIQRMDITYIPDKEGKVTIPEINIDWWDVNKKEARVYTLPEWNLSVAAGEEGAVAASTQNPAPMEDANPEAEHSLGETLEPIPGYWGWEILSAIALGILAIISGFFYFKARNKRVIEEKPIAAKKPLVDLQALRNSLLDACQQNDKHMAARLLIKTIKAAWNDSSINNLGLVATNLTQGREVVRDLEQSLYGTKDQAWDGSDLYRLVENGLQRKTPKVISRSDIGLAPLYPT